MKSIEYYQENLSNQQKFKKKFNLFKKNLQKNKLIY